MHIRRITLTNFRNYANLELALPRSPLLLYGANAQGKTNFLEAVHLLSAGGSALTSLDRQLINWGAGESDMPYARVWAEVVRRDSIQELDVVLERKTTGNGVARVYKTLRVDRKRRRRVDFVGHLNIVLFVPQDMELIAGSPSERRRYLDDALSQVNPTYAHALQQYKEALRQRNAALRYLREKRGDPAQLRPFEEVLAREGVCIVNRRRHLLRIFSGWADRIHQQLTGTSNWLNLNYLPSFDPAESFGSSGPGGSAPISRQSSPSQSDDSELIDKFRMMLEERRGQEIARGATLVGPHRDEFRVIAGDPTHMTREVDLGTYGSRGQQRTAVLALKLTELEWMRDEIGESPVLLLDEVLAELDEERRNHLLSRVSSVEQAVLTATDVQMFSDTFRHQAVTWKVQGGTIRAE